MPGEKDLKALLKKMSPTLNEGEWVFITQTGDFNDYLNLNPLCAFREKEGLTLIIPKQTAVFNKIDFDAVYKYITLEVHSSLDAVGLTAAVSTKLTEDGISANVVAAFYHDHIFVQTQHAKQAVNSLKELGK